MRMSVRLNLPREADSVPAVRRLLRCALSILHVDKQSGADLEIALTEACANVVKHAAGAEKFEVLLNVAADHCAIDVVDNGAGFDVAAVDSAMATPADQTSTAPDTAGENGRGLFLIRALSDNVRMQSTPRRGCLIHFEKTFSFVGGPDAALPA
jgi:serine/threonine-protein kinase RsbW